MSCAAEVQALDICPTADEITPQLLALLPRGRAWSTHDGGPHPGTPAHGFWYAVASVWEWVNGRICALADEFTCGRQSETHDVWMEEYGLPDGCDPFPDLSTKVAAIGGTRCEYYVSVAARAGWAISCSDTNSGCGGKAGRARAGCAQSGRNPKSGTIVIRVDLAHSPSFTGTLPPSASDPGPPRRRMLAGKAQTGQNLVCTGAGAPRIRPFAGVAKAGGRPYCPPDFSALACIVERIVSAHATIVYEVAR